MFKQTGFTMLWEHKKKAGPNNEWVSAVSVRLGHRGHFSRRRCAHGNALGPASTPLALA
jgi:hypothetical protein